MQNNPKQNISNLVSSSWTQQKRRSLNHQRSPFFYTPPYLFLTIKRHRQRWLTLYSVMKRTPCSYKMNNPITMANYYFLF